MTNDTHPALVASVSSLASDTKFLLREVGFEDRRAIIWATFSDDNGATRVVYRSYRDDATTMLSLLKAVDLRQGLESARLRGLTKVLWGLEDGVLE